MKKSLAILIFSLFIQHVYAQGLDLYQKKEYTSGKDTLRYRILYPNGFREHKTYPLVVFLHGSGERGSDNAAQLIHGGEVFAREAIRHYFPAIVIFPQCPAESRWSNFKKDEHEIGGFSILSNGEPPVSQQLVKALMDSLVEAGEADAKKIYLGGLSMGAFGTYDMIARYPDYFAAAFTICGASDISLVSKRAKHIPLWIFHGKLDTIVPPTTDRELYKALMTSGASSVMYTEYPEANHNSWDAAFAEPKLLPWLFSNKKRHKKIK